MRDCEKCRKKREARMLLQKEILGQESKDCPSKCDEVSDNISEDSKDEDIL